MDSNYEACKRAPRSCRRQRQPRGNVGQRCRENLEILGNRERQRHFTHTLSRCALELPRAIGDQHA